jgi:hypothetical protein
MRRLGFLLVPCAFVIGTSCSSSGSTQSPPASAPAPASVAPAAGAPAAGREGGPPGMTGRPPMRRAPMTPEMRAARRDSLSAEREKLVAQLMQQIAGREDEPAGKVFKNVKLLQDVPAKQFLTIMDHDYGRGLGVNCTFCHVANQWDSDRREEKETARMMIAMTDTINRTQLSKLHPNRLGKTPVINCVSCHRGYNEPNLALVP